MDLRSLGSVVWARGDVGGSQGDRWLAETGLETAPDTGLCKLGWRGAQSARLHGMGRSERRRAAEKGAPVSQLRYQFAWLSQRGRQSFTASTRERCSAWGG